MSPTQTQTDITLRTLRKQSAFLRQQKNETSTRHEGWAEEIDALSWMEKLSIFSPYGNSLFDFWHSAWMVHLLLRQEMIRNSLPGGLLSEVVEASFDKELWCFHAICKLADFIAPFSAPPPLVWLRKQEERSVGRVSRDGTEWIKRFIGVISPADNLLRTVLLACTDKGKAGRSFLCWRRGIFHRLVFRVEDLLFIVRVKCLCRMGSATWELK